MKKKNNRIKITYSLEEGEVPGKVCDNVEKLNQVTSQIKETLDSFLTAMENSEYKLATSLLAKVANKADYINNVAEDNLFILDGYVGLQSDKLDALFSLTQGKGTEDD